MLTSLLLIRHAMCDAVGDSLAGRAAGVHLNAAGRAQAEELATRLAAGEARLDAIFSSPLERALETAAPIAARLELPIRQLDALTEVDFGNWTGRRLADLAGTPWWRRFNVLRSVTPAPSGELMLDVQARAVRALEKIRCAFPEGRCLVVSHGDVIRAAVAHYAGIPLDMMARLEVAPASMTLLRLTDAEITIRAVNLSDGPLRDL